MQKGRTLVLGVGNLLLSDDGLGIHTIQRLQEVVRLPEEVQVLDGGTCGLDLLYYLEGVSRLIIVDAIASGEEPGATTVITGDRVPSYISLKMSPHEIGIPDMLMAAKLRDLYPGEVVVLGVQPEKLEAGVDLSPSVAAQVDVLVEMILDQLESWGVRVRGSASAG